MRPPERLQTIAPIQESWPELSLTRITAGFVEAISPESDRNR